MSEQRLPTEPQRRKKSETLGLALARFMMLVDITQNPVECWEWLGPKVVRQDGKESYGRFWFDGEQVYAHRWIYQVIHGKLDVDIKVRHRCDNEPCVNPSHLLEGSPSDNTRDMFERGRNPNRKGERHPRSRLRDEDIVMIRKLASDGQRYSDIANVYGMSAQQISKIVNRINWGHIL